MFGTFEKDVMLNIHGQARIFLFSGPTDLRKGFEGLCWIVEQNLAEEITSGAFFVFVNRRRDRMKVLYWDVDGFAIWYKRLEQGSFSRTHLKNETMNRKEFFMLLEGIIPKRIQRRYSIS